MRRLVTVAACLLAGCTGTGPDPPATSPEATSRPPVTPSTTTPPTPRSFTLVATGDVLLHPRLWQQARADAARTGRGLMDFAPMLAPIRPLVRGADLAICHLETPLAPAGGPYAGYPRFAGPPQIVPALAATGYDACSTASNHSFDGGAAGIRRTLDALDAAGIAHAGSARSAAEARRTTLLTVQGVRVALLSYTYGFNGIGYPGGDRWRANVIDVDGIRSAARAARARGADAVVLALHWGTEYVQAPDARQRALAPVVTRIREVDLVIGHHAHVVEPVQRVGRTWVVYGMGNLVAWHATPGPANAEGLLVRFTLARAASGRYRVTRAGYEPLLVARDAPVRVLDAAAALARRRYGSAGRARLEQAVARTDRVVNSLGARADGLRRITP
jgi:poly-gamma-glutamate synthesis protein (capsule biosynthesis protein)